MVGAGFFGGVVLADEDGHALAELISGDEGVIDLVEDREAAEGGGFRGNAVTLSFEILGDDRNRQDERDDGHDGEDATDDHTQLLRRGPCC